MGETVGRYVVLEEVGRGGMGRVFRAYDPKLRREVAVKQMWAMALGAEGARRLVAEARAMAQLSHANVVAVYDVEDLGAGSVGLVMEYVAGATLEQWLDGGRHPWHEVVRRFIAAGRGLSAAHAAGLLHRDFKPANVLVAGGVVKVTDFGIAKAAAGRSTEPATPPPMLGVVDGTADVRTEAGTVMGTPKYMAPEQHYGEPLTAAADQYALCVALWAALTGSPPFRGGLAALAQGKAAGPPPWRGASVPRAVVEALRRGLASDPRDRWPSVDALLDVLDRDPGARRRGLMWSAGAATVIGALVAAWYPREAESPCTGARDRLAGVWDPSRRAAVEMAFDRLEASYAAPSMRRAVAAMDGHAAAWVAMHTEACEATTIHGDQSPKVMDLRMACLRRARTEMGAVAEVLTQIDAAALPRTGQLVGSLRPLDRCSDVAALQADVEPPSADEAAVVEEIRRLSADSKTARIAGRSELGLAIVQKARKLAESVEYGPVRAELAFEYGATLDTVGRYPEAEEALREAVQLSARWRQWPSLEGAVYLLMYVVGSRLQRPEEALALRELAQGLAAESPSGRARIHSAVAVIYGTMGRHREAEAELRQVIASYEGFEDDVPINVAFIHNSLATELSAQGKASEADAELRRALAIGESLYGEDHPAVPAFRGNLGANLLGHGKTEEAQLVLRPALAQADRLVGPEHPIASQIAHNLAIARFRLKDHIEAESLARRAMAARFALGDHHPDMAGSRGLLVEILLDAGKPRQAVAEAERGWAAAERPDVAADQRGEAAFLLVLALTAANPDEGPSRVRALAQRAVDDLTTAGDGHSDKIAEMRAVLARVGGHRR